MIGRLVLSGIDHELFKRATNVANNIRVLSTISRNNQSGRLVISRHGQTAFNVAELWAGWYNTDLTEYGVEQAINLGRIFKDSGFYPDVVMTTVLNRAQDTAQTALDFMGHRNVDIEKRAELLELHPGALIGSKKNSDNKKFLKEWFTRPPAMTEDHQFHPARCPKTIGLPQNGVGAESMQDVAQRLKELYEELTIRVKDGQNVLIVGHSNNLSAMISHMTGVTEKKSIKNAEAMEVNFRPEGEKMIFCGMSNLLPNRLVKQSRTTAIVNYEVPQIKIF